jgi:hypothetical protein
MTLRIRNQRQAGLRSAFQRYRPPHNVTLSDFHLFLPGGEKREGGSALPVVSEFVPPLGAGEVEPGGCELLFVEGLQVGVCVASECCCFGCLVLCWVGFVGGVVVGWMVVRHMVVMGVLVGGVFVCCPCFDQVV